METAKEQLSRENLTRRMAPLQAERGALESRLSELSVELVQTESEEVALGERLAAAQARLVKTSTTLQALHDQNREAHAERTRLTQQQAEVSEMLRAALDRLQLFRTAQEETEREEQLRSIVVSLMRIFPGKFKP